MSRKVIKNTEQHFYGDFSDSTSFENIDEENESNDPHHNREDLDLNLSSNLQFFNSNQAIVMPPFRRHLPLRRKKNCYIVLSSAETNLNSVIKKIKKLDKNQLQKYNGIKINFINASPNGPNRQNSTNSSSPIRRTNSSEASYRNLPKILGVFILSYSKKAENREQVEKFLREISGQIIYPSNFRVNYDSFIKWLIDKNMNKEFCKLKTFRDVWGFYLAESHYKTAINKHFCYVLKRLSEHVMRYVFLGYIMKRVSADSMKLENALCYIDKLPVFHQGLEDPANFLSISRK